jgi:hypothetical protein
MTQRIPQQQPHVSPDNSRKLTKSTLYILIIAYIHFELWHMLLLFVSLMLHTNDSNTYDNAIVKQTYCMLVESFTQAPVRIQVRIGPPYPLASHKRRLNGAGLWMRPVKPRPCVTAGVTR